VLPNSSLIKQSKPDKPVNFHPWMSPPQPITMQELDSDEQIVIVDDISPWKVIGVPILLCVSICLI